MIADLRNEVVLREPTTTRDDSGHFTRTYADKGKYMAEVRSPRGDEIMRGDAVEGIAQVVFKIRYPFREAAPSTLWRISYDSRVYEITDVQDVDGRRRWLHLFTKEVQT
jgi:SPP1 family predicted phage head-tail adaptor